MQPVIAWMMIVIVSGYPTVGTGIATQAECMSNATEVLKMIKKVCTAATCLCKSYQGVVVVGPAGPMGPVGMIGPQGPAGTGTGGGLSCADDPICLSTR